MTSQQRVESLMEGKDYEQAIKIRKDAVLLSPEGSSRHLTLLRELADLYLERFNASPYSSDDLDEAIDIRREICRFSRPESPSRLMDVYHLSELLQRLCCPEIRPHGFLAGDSKTINLVPLREAIVLQREANNLIPENHPLRPNIVGKLGSALVACTDSLTDRHESIALLRLAISMIPEIDERRLPLLKNLSLALDRLRGASEAGSTATLLEELVNVRRDIAENDPTKESRVANMTEIGESLARLCSPPLSHTSRAKELYDLSCDLLQISPDTSIAQYWKSQAEFYLEPRQPMFPNEPDHAKHLERFPSLPAQFLLDFDPEKSAILTSVESDERTLDLNLSKNLSYLIKFASQTEQGRNEALRNIGVLFSQRHLEHRDVRDLNASIEYTEVVHIADPTITSVTKFLITLLLRRYYLTGDTRDYDRWHTLQLQTNEPPPPIIGPTLLHDPWKDLPPPPPRVFASQKDNAQKRIAFERQSLATKRDSATLFNLASALYDLFQNFIPEDLENLSEALQLIIESEGIEPLVKSRWLKSDIHLCWYRSTGDTKMLDEAIAYGKDRAFYERYILSGNENDLDQAIRLSREIRGSAIKGGIPITSLGRYLNTRYALNGDIDDLQESLRFGSAEDIAEAYLLSYRTTGRVEELELVFEECLWLDELESNFHKANKSIIHCYALLAKNERRHDRSLVSLAEEKISELELWCPFVLKPHTLKCHAHVLGTLNSGAGDMTRAVSKSKEALDLLPRSHVHRPSFMAIYGDLLRQLYCLTNEPELLLLSIEYQTTALSHTRLTNPSYGERLVALGHALSLNERNGHLNPECNETAVFLFKKAATLLSAPLKVRYVAAVNWAHNAVSQRDEETLEAFELGLDILHRAASLSLDIRERHHTLVSMATGIAGDAAACAIQQGLFGKAVEFLERGRSIFWQQLLQLRSPIDMVAESDASLADRLQELSRDLIISGLRTRGERDTEQRLNFLAREQPKRVALAKEWDILVDRVRSMPGLEDFLRPSSYRKLAGAARGRIVVILSATSTTCHALIIQDASGFSEPRCLELPAMSSEQVKKITSVLRVALKQSNRQLRQASVGDSTTERGMVLVRVETRSIFRLLKILWVNVVKPVFDFLQLKATTEPPQLSWSCVGAVALLPIHAAGLYSDDGKSIVATSDFVVSSYSPTLSNLLPAKSEIEAVETKVLLIGQTYVNSKHPLPNVSKELKHVEDVIRSRVSGGKATCVSLMNERGACGVVLEELGDTHIAHLACHGIAASNPLDSGLLLHDGELKVEQLMRSALEHANLAFLSACQTAEINPLEPDESIHIASAMLFAGFKGVVGTMWPIDDEDAPGIATAFYQNLVSKDGGLDPSKASQALHDAINGWRKDGIDPLRWASFIYLGL